VIWAIWCVSLLYYGLCLFGCYHVLHIFALTTADVSEELQTGSGSNFKISTRLSVAAVSSRLTDTPTTRQPEHCSHAARLLPFKVGCCKLNGRRRAYSFRHHGYRSSTLLYTGSGYSSCNAWFWRWTIRYIRRCLFSIGQLCFDKLFRMSVC